MIDYAVTGNQQLTTEFGDVPAYRLELAAAYADHGMIHQALARFADAERTFRAALALRMRLAADFPEAPYYRLELGIGHCQLGGLLQKTGRPTAALASFRQAMAQAQSLTGEAAAVPEYQRFFAQRNGNLPTRWRRSEAIGVTLGHCELAQTLAVSANEVSQHVIILALAQTSNAPGPANTRAS